MKKPKFHGWESIRCPTSASRLAAGYEDHQVTWHSPFVFVPRLNRQEQHKVAENIAGRLKHSAAKTAFLVPRKGVSSYSAEDPAFVKQAVETLISLIES